MSTNSLQRNPSVNTHHLRILGRLFEGLASDALEKILQVGQQLTLEPGAYLFHQGDRDTALYIVLSGRLRAVAEEGGKLHILGDIGEGEPTGEFALFTNDPRMASVLAIRKTTVLEITRDEYHALVAQNPAFASVLTRFLVKRLKRNILEQHMSATPRNIALINLQPGHDLNPWTDDIEKTLVASGIPIRIIDHETKPEGAHQSVFESLEQHDGLNIFVCSEDHPEWSRQSLLYADLVIVATEFSADPGIYAIEKTLDLYAQSILNRKIYIVFLHEDVAPLPQKTSRWLADRNVNLHIHVRRNHPADIRRFCRIISNQAVGVVLGGGGAKGYAHVGALRALLEAGVEIDFLGGTSAGALYGIGMSHCDFDFEKIDALCAESARRRLTSNDYAWPFVSIMTGKKMSRFMKDMFGDADLEDIWINSYCVSTNFSSSGTRVHERGLASKMVQASIAIPGVFPPVVIEQQLHVDGCVVDNLPVEPMYRFPVRHIIAISLSSLSNRRVDYAETPSVAMLLWDKITGKRRYRVPGIASLIINSLTLNSRQRQEATKAKVSLYFEMDLKGVGLLDDKKWSYTMKNGHDQVKAYLETLPEREKFWWRKG
ncbi:patatin-like phospholipase family protein [Flavisolibacter sp. BT320]|nr:patatin-like phospholipase family protein [Flavisolibacter longurius]